MVSQQRSVGSATGSPSACRGCTTRPELARAGGRVAVKGVIHATFSRAKGVLDVTFSGRKGVLHATFSNRKVVLGGAQPGTG